MTSPLEVTQRLAAVVPRRWLHLLRAFEVLAPNARLRPLVVPLGPEVQWQANEAAVAHECVVETAQARSHRISWARRLKREFNIDVQHFPNRGARELKVIVAIMERPVIEKILSDLGPDPQPPPWNRTREAGQGFAT